MGNPMEVAGMAEFQKYDGLSLVTVSEDVGISEKDLLHKAIVDLGLDLWTWFDFPQKNPVLGLERSGWFKIPREEIINLVCKDEILVYASLMSGGWEAFSAPTNRNNLPFMRRLYDFEECRIKRNDLYFLPPDIQKVLAFTPVEKKKRVKGSDPRIENTDTRIIKRLLELLMEQPGRKFFETQTALIDDEIVSKKDPRLGSSLGNRFRQAEKFVNNNFTDSKLKNDNQKLGLFLIYALKHLLMTRSAQPGSMELSDVVTEILKFSPNHPWAEKDKIKSRLKQAKTTKLKSATNNIQKVHS
jgi:hypothetical protein